MGQPSEVDRGGGLEPAQNRRSRIVRAAGPTVILGKTVRATGDGSGPACECLVV